MIDKRSIKRVYTTHGEPFEDEVAIEAPLEISIQKASALQAQKISVTMRTPGQDGLLALGFLFTEGILADFDQVISVNEMVENEIVIVVNDETELNTTQVDRNFYTSSSCGVCGKSSIDAIKTVSSFEIQTYDLTVRASLLYQLQDLLREQQTTFNRTGGIHAAALFDSKGSLTDFQEDVGRHNAMDKLVGNCWKNGQLPAKQHILLLSGRASFELIQKAAMAGIPIICSVGAPSSLAIDLAAEQGITLIGFLKSDRFNLYTHHERIREKA